MKGEQRKEERSAGGLISISSAWISAVIVLVMLTATRYLPLLSITTPGECVVYLGIREPIFPRCNAMYITVEVNMEGVGQEKASY